MFVVWYSPNFISVDALQNGLFEPLNPDNAFDFPPWTTAGAVYYDPSATPSYVGFLNNAANKQGIIRQKFNYTCDINDKEFAMSAGMGLHLISS